MQVGLEKDLGDVSANAAIGHDNFGEYVQQLVKDVSVHYQLRTEGGVDGTVFEEESRQLANRVLGE